MENGLPFADDHDRAGWLPHHLCHRRPERDEPGRPEDENVEVAFPCQSEDLIGGVAYQHGGGDLAIGPPLGVAGPRCKSGFKVLLSISRNARRGPHVHERQFSIQDTRQISGVLKRRA